MMVKYLRIDAAGFVTSYGECQDEAISALPFVDGETIVQTDTLPCGQFRKWRYDGEGLIDCGPVHEQTYADYRRAAYPPAEDYLDAVVKGDQAAIDAYIKACLDVKARYPKPDELG